MPNSASATLIKSGRLAIHSSRTKAISFGKRSANEGALDCKLRTGPYYRMLRGRISCFFLATVHIQSIRDRQRGRIARAILQHKDGNRRIQFPPSLLFRHRNGEKDIIPAVTRSLLPQ
mmetsp:Transcript_27907/g.52312  ORF Transcript_27907/g.52312 Transcript_27907/m.52312 type:complete len:118 (+) Transcript_27907:1919-2272(+)